MELKGENHFKVRAFEKAEQTLAGRDDLLARARGGTLDELPGIGKGIASIVTEFLLNGHSSVYEELEKSLPAGLSELTEVPGLGPKKAMVLIDQLGIRSVGELEYACRENRLLHLKGFGSKIQQKILEGVMFRNSNQGLQKLSDLELLAEKLLIELRKSCPGKRVNPTGALRRKLEVLSELEFLIEVDSKGKTQAVVEKVLAQFASSYSFQFPVKLHTSPPERYEYEWVKTTGSVEHWKALGAPEFEGLNPELSEEGIYRHFKLPFIPPEARETGEEVSLARAGQFPDLLPWDGLRGVFHNHTTRSDGRASLEQMVEAAERQGFEYIGISDHSQSAFYAQGLKVADLAEQKKEIKEVQKRHPRIRIFWGIESDILADGSLDYDEKHLKGFDFVIASIHSRMNMNREEMTTRILKAIRNPYTRFLGHPTGRLLLGRKAFDVDMEAVIAEAALCNVVVELNANPARLDLDWRWGKEMRKKGTLTSINPDAHDVEGLKDVHYGVAMARKGLIPVGQIVNAMTVSEVEQWLKRS